MSDFAKFKKKQKEAAGQTFILCLNILCSLTTELAETQVLNTPVEYSQRGRMRETFTRTLMRY